MDTSRWFSRAVGAAASWWCLSATARVGSLEAWPFPIKALFGLFWLGVTAVLFISTWVLVCVMLDQALAHLLRGRKAPEVRRRK